MQVKGPHVSLVSLIFFVNGEGVGCEMGELERQKHPLLQGGSSGHRVKHRYDIGNEYLENVSAPTGLRSQAFFPASVANEEQSEKSQTPKLLKQGMREQFYFCFTSLET